MSGYDLYRSSVGAGSGFSKINAGLISSTTDYYLDENGLVINTTYWYKMLAIDDDGNEIKRITGVPSEGKLRGEIEKLLGLRKSFLSRIWGAS